MCEVRGYLAQPSESELRGAQSFVADMAGATAPWENPADGLETSGLNLLLKTHKATEAKESFVKSYIARKL
eukprot:4964250-Pyramimonas_sp.AAC.1